MDALLSENKASLKSLQAYKEQVQSRTSNSKRLEEEIQSVADRLASLQGNIENATYEEKFKAVSALVKSITVNKNKVGQKDIPVVTITYRFNDPESLPAFSPSIPAIVGNYTLTDSSRRPQQRIYKQHLVLHTESMLILCQISQNPTSKR
ncbi:MAG TPA: hypothetical protein VLX61_03225 [Anaerolineales bacterium]|nr:hypothetical protein [Anaerolineales bacterium]